MPCTEASSARICISALSGGGGKTLLSLGLARAFSRQGLAVQPFKKGPDYIDAAWLSLAAGRQASNLDPYFLPPARLRALFRHVMERSGARLALLEGNRGLFDGMDVRGSCATAELARTLDCPVLLSLDCTKMTRTAAALVAGIRNFEPGLRLAGVVLNQVASARHEGILREAITTYTDVPVLGAIPRLRENPLPERHMGLASLCGDELSPQAQEILEKLADVVRDHVDMERVLALADDLPDLPEEPDFWDEAAWAGEGAVAPSGTGRSAACHAGTASAAGSGEARKAVMAAGTLSGRALQTTVPEKPQADSAAGMVAGACLPRACCPADSPEPAPRIGYVRDRALWFYYEENLEALRRAGAELVRLSLLDDAPWPELDGLYLGGGFPEDWARELASSPHLARLATLAGEGLPIYAECGGFMVLASALERDGQRWPMSAIFPVETRFCPKPQGLGYVRADVVLPNPYFPQGSVLRGHEFHYSLCHEPAAVSGRLEHALRLRKGTGMGRDAAGHGRDGLVSGRVWAAYCHIFAPAVPGWAPRFVDLARCYHRERTGG
ncbi:cobyrinate a,c-diamide synthase [Desulfovibrio sp.]|uniref:cobyrinate a,c-diamide synthase n=1 Tax=Desulfovibrio sp. TaxID=885 RepID=UPI00257CC5D7|nr:cobyrinate a,c-diamide synthase [Desulfovibrio sp.]MBR2610403.1 cobyrinate a,c-diamide synthase [Desulfovibrio sp.]